MLDWYTEDREISHWEFISKKKKEVVERKDRVKVQLAAKRAELLDREIPYQRELAYITQLVNYMNKLKVQHGLVEPEDDMVAKQVNESQQNQAAEELINKNIADGKMEVAYEKEELKTVGGKKNKKKNVKKVIIIDNTFRPSIDSIKMFGTLKMSPPIGTDELDLKIGELVKEKAKYEALQKEAEGEDVEVTDEELLKQIQAEDKERRSQRDNDGAGRGGPRVARGAGRGRRGGAGGGHREFEQDSDEEEDRQPKQAARKQKRADLSDMANFPTL